MTGDTDLLRGLLDSLYRSRPFPQIDIAMSDGTTLTVEEPSQIDSIDELVTLVFGDRTYYLPIGQITCIRVIE